MTELKVEVLEVHGLQRCRCVVLEGEIGLQGAPVFARQLESVISEGLDALILDLSGVTYMNSSALAAMLTLEDRLNGGYVALVGVQDKAKVIMDNLGITNLFQVLPTREEAIRSARHHCGS
jgi:anti-anti-sigma factor